ncbi:MAG: PLP-dependent aminotransferase family protein [Desulfovibrionaceae bacterium]|jgi:DNA-binding transcriptional MocR family regulator|nr:PLP-dependent aminotransferase family protein [Desulfovibrionaceae bacterium]
MNGIRGRERHRDEAHGGARAGEPGADERTTDARHAPATFRYRRVERHILGMVEDGALAPGDRLPSLRRLSRALRASISTVSQAYVELERKGVIESRPRSGFFVRRDLREKPAPPAAPAPSLSANLVNRSTLIRNVLEVVGNHDIISLGMANPDPTLMPAKALGSLLHRTLREDPVRAMDYEPIGGNTDLKRHIALRAMEAGIRVRPEEILITNGALEAMTIGLRCLTRPGDAVVIPSPSYYCFLQTLEHLGLRAVEIPSHPDVGVDPADLRTVLDRLDVHACILSPNFNNPDGSLTPDDAKREIVRLLGERNIPLLEDDVVGDLYFGDQPRPTTCKTYDTKNIVTHCSSFSKTLASGFRVGWMIPAGYMAKAFDIKTVTNLSTASPMQMAVAAYLDSGRYDKHLRKLRQAVGDEAEAMRLHAQRHFPEGTRISHPKGGATLWLELDPKIDGSQFFLRAKQLGIGLCPGSIFTTQERFKNYIRLTCNGIWNPTRAAAIQTLGSLAAAMAAE